MTDPQQRIGELETQVAALERQVATLQRGRASDEGEHRGQPPAHGHTGWPWIHRAVLLFMGTALGAATFFTLRAQGVTFSDATRLGRDLATLPLDYGLVACGVAATLALLFYVTKRWLSFLAVALLAVYLTYLLHAAPAEETQGAAFWALSASMTLSYLVFSSACIRESWNRGRRGRVAAFLALANSAGFFYLMQAAVRTQIPHLDWALLLCFVVVLGGFTIIAETSGPQSNYMFQAFLVKTALAATLAVHTIVQGEWLWIALAAECFILALAYQRTGIVALKALNLALLLTTTFFCARTFHTSDSIEMAGMSLPGACCFVGGVSAIFIVTAWFYERFPLRLAPSDRRLSGHWFLADTFLDAAPGTAAMLHAAAAALVGIVFMAVDYGDDAALPGYLLGQTAVLSVLGILLKTPQVEIAGALSLVAAHVSYYFVLSVQWPEAQEPRVLLGMGLALALASYLSGWRWTRSLARLYPTAPTRGVLYAIPHLLGTGALAFAAAFAFKGVYGPLAQAGGGLLLVGMGIAAAYWPIVACGVAALGCATLTTSFLLFYRQSGLPPAGPLAVYLAALLAALLIAERALAVGVRRRWTHLGDLTGPKTLVVLLASLFALSSADHWPGPDHRIFAWLSIAAGMGVVGALFNEGRYRWAAMLVLLASIALLFRGGVAGFSARTSYQHILAAVFVFLFLVASWMHDAYKRNRRAPHEGAPSGDGDAL